MALNSRNWFLKNCYLNVRNKTALAPLADRALMLGFGKDNTSGHIMQACGAAQEFLARYPQHRKTIRDASPTRPFRLEGKILADWIAFLDGRHGTYGRSAF